MGAAVVDPTGPDERARAAGPTGRGGATRAAVRSAATRPVPGGSNGAGPGSSRYGRGGLPRRTGARGGGRGPLEGAGAGSGLVADAGFEVAGEARGGPAFA